MLYVNVYMYLSMRWKRSSIKKGIMCHENDCEKVMGPLGMISAA